MVVPESLDRVPEAWLGGPVPRTWTLWHPQSKQTTVRVNRVVRDQGGCTDLTLLTLDKQPPRPDSLEIAVDTRQVIEPVAPLKTTDREFMRMVPSIEAIFRANESRVLRSPGLMRESERAEALKEVDLGALPIKIDLSRLSLAPTSLYYFEARKETTRANHMLFGVRVAAWIRRAEAGRWQIIDVKGSVYTDETVTGLRPLAGIRVGQRTFVVTAIGYYEGAAFAIDELLAGSVQRIVTADAGGC